MSGQETGGQKLRERIVSAVRTHAIDSTRNDRAQDADYCLCGALVEDWDEHWTDAALTLVQPELDAKDAQIAELKISAQAEAQAAERWRTEAEQAEAERDKTLRDLGTANGDAEDAERERDDIANTLLAQDFATAEATARAEQAEAERDRLRAAEQRVRELHSPDEYGDCKGCGLTRYEEAIPWAECDTIAALDQDGSGT